MIPRRLRSRAGLSQSALAVVAVVCLSGCEGTYEQRRQQSYAACVDRGQPPLDCAEATERMFPTKVAK